jgi:uncharacterized protein (TIGR03067 family)
MKKLILAVALACVALASDDPRDYDDRVTMGSLEGTWRGHSGEDNGVRIPAAQLEDARLIFKRGNSAELIEGGHTQPITYRAEPSRRPAHLDLVMSDGKGKGETIQLIYSIEGDTLKLALFTGNGGMRPTEFKKGAGSNLRILIFKRERN